MGLESYRFCTPFGYFLSQAQKYLKSFSSPIDHKLKPFQGEMVIIHGAEILAFARTFFEREAL